MFFVQVCPIWRGLICRGLICRGPICHSTKKCGAQFAAKSARGLIYQGPICLEPQGVKYMSRLPPTEESCWTCEKVEPPCNNNEWWRLWVFPFSLLTEKWKERNVDTCGLCSGTESGRIRRSCWGKSIFETSYHLLKPHIWYMSSRLTIDNIKTGTSKKVKPCQRW